MALRDLPIKTIIELLNIKQAAIQNADLSALSILKKNHPDLFSETELSFVKHTLYQVYAYQHSFAYQKLKRQTLKDSLKCIVNNEIKP